VLPWEAARAEIDAVATGPLAAESHRYDGTLPVALAASSVLPLDVVTYDGRVPAAHARCFLAGRGHLPHRHGVDADVDAAEPSLRATARHCPAYRSPRLGSEDVVAKTEAFLRLLREGGSPDPEPAMQLVPRLSELEARGVELLVALLREVRPVSGPKADHRPLLETVLLVLEGVDPDRCVEEVARLLGPGASPEEVDLARRFVRRSRKPDHLPALEAAIARSGRPPTADDMRLLWWLYSSGDAEPARTEAFARSYGRWVGERPDAEALTHATALLDLGEAGAGAYAEGLRGPRRRIFVLGLLGLSRTVPPEVADALLEPVDARTPAPERHAVWTAAYRTAPPESADALAAALDRLDPAVRSEATDVLEAVRHRAGRSGRTR
jgi:hypothetical protein